MYTTIAPPDAVGQRGGRLNRTGKYYKNGSEYVLKLFNQQEYHPYNENIIMDSWKYFEEGPYTYYKIKKVCDKVYKDVILRKNRNYIDYFHKNILFGDHHSTITFGDDEGKSLKIREDNYQQIDVVPSRVFDEAQILITKNKAFWVEYKVRIPLYKFKMDIKENGESIHFRKHQKFNIIECDYEYNYEYGVSFNKTFSRVAIF
jgi:CRISPR-associated endonuclease/helicase Cas3